MRVCVKLASTRLVGGSGTLHLSSAVATYYQRYLTHSYTVNIYAMYTMDELSMKAISITAVVAKITICNQRNFYATDEYGCSENYNLQSTQFLCCFYVFPTELRCYYD